MQASPYLIIGTILLMSAAIFSLRALPFFLPAQVLENTHVKYIGLHLPASIMTILVLYCLKDVSLASSQQYMPYLLPILLTIALHLWKRNVLFSIGLATLSHILLLNMYR